jgi:hypothetical protein
MHGRWGKSEAKHLICEIFSRYLARSGIVMYNDGVLGKRDR